MSDNGKKTENWNSRGKSIRGLIKELETFEDKDLEVCISIDGGEVVLPISFVGRKDGKCLLAYMN